MNQPFQTASSPHRPQHPEVHLQDYLNVLFRRRTIFLGSTAAVFLAMALYSFLTKPVYQATATLHVKDEKMRGSVLGDLALNSVNPIDAELEILKSRSNAENVVRRLHLDWRLSKRSPGMKLRLLEFTSSAQEPSYEITLTGTATYSIKDASGTLVGSGTSGTLLSTPGFTLLLDGLTGRPGDSCRLDLLPFNATAADVRKTIKASEVGKKTNVIDISYESTDPEKARDVVNTLVQVYLDQTIAFKTEEANRTVTFVEEQLKGVRNELDNAEKNLQTYKTSAGVVQLNEEAQNLIRQLSDVERQRVDVTLQKKQVEYALASLKEARQRGHVYSPAVMRDDALVGSMSTKLAELEVQKRALLAEYTDSHPSVRIVQGQIDELLKKIQATYETGLKNLTKQEANIGQQLARYEGDLRKLPAAERDLAKLTRITTVNAGIYTFLLQKHEEARIAKASTISNINIVDPAITPEKPIKPNKRKNLLLGLLLGLMTGIGLAFFIDYLDDTIKDADEAKRILGLPILALIPYISTGADADQDAATATISHHEPKSHVAEAFRSLRTSVHFSAISQEKKVILITSTFPGEGKSTVAANYAITLAQTGDRVLIMDCDLRRPTVHEKFKHNRIPGLSELLTGDVGSVDAIHDSGIANLHILGAGTIPPNPAELLGSAEMGALLQKLRVEYDHIVIDAPPLLAVTDAPVLTAISDLVLLVFEPGKVPAKIATRVREILASIKAPVAGIVVCDRSSVDESYGYYYGKYGNRYGYAYGYSQESPEHGKPWSWLKRICRPLFTGKRPK